MTASGHSEGWGSPSLATFGPEGSLKDAAEEKQEINEDEEAVNEKRNSVA